MRHDVIHSRRAASVDANTHGRRAPSYYEVLNTVNKKHTTNLYEQITAIIQMLYLIAD